MTEHEMLELIKATAAGLAVILLDRDRQDDPLLPPGVIEWAIQNHKIGISQLGFIFEAQLRTMIPVVPEDVPVEVG